MAALTASRMYRSRSYGRSIPVPLKAGAKVFQGGLVMIEIASGYGIPAASGAATGFVVGWALADADNSAGASGALSVQVQTGVIKLNNAGANTLVQTDLGARAYVTDDNTVQKTAAGATNVAGIVDQFDADGGVWVAVAPELSHLSA